MYANIEIYRADDNIYITRCPELNLYANGNTQREAVLKLKRKIAKFLRKSNTFTDAKKDIDYTTHYYSTRFPQTH
jgi:hypothetical protein